METAQCAGSFQPGARDLGEAPPCDRNVRRGERGSPKESMTLISHAIQLAIAPVFLLTGIAALIGVMANRLARTIDRARYYEQYWEQMDEPARAAARVELADLERRRHLASWAINFCSSAALLVCIVIAALFIEAFFQRRSQMARGRALRWRDGGADQRSRLLLARGVSGDAHGTHHVCQVSVRKRGHGTFTMIEEVCGISPGR